MGWQGLHDRHIFAVGKILVGIDQYGNTVHHHCVLSGIVFIVDAVFNGAADIGGPGEVVFDGGLKTGAGVFELDLVPRHHGSVQAVALAAAAPAAAAFAVSRAALAQIVSQLLKVGHGLQHGQHVVVRPLTLHAHIAHQGAVAVIVEVGQTHISARLLADEPTFRFRVPERIAAVIALWLAVDGIQGAVMVSGAALLDQRCEDDLLAPLAVAVKVAHGHGLHLLVGDLG